MLQWLATALESNSERSKMQMDPMRAASHSFFINVSALLLQLCEPFMDAMAHKAWPRLDPGCGPPTPADSQHLMKGGRGKGVRLVIDESSLPCTRFWWLSVFGSETTHCKAAG